MAARYKETRLQEAFQMWLQGRQSYMIDRAETDPLRESKLITVAKRARITHVQSQSTPYLNEQAAEFLKICNTTYLEKTGENLELSQVAFYEFQKDRFETAVRPAGRTQVYQ